MGQRFLCWKSLNASVRRKKGIFFWKHDRPKCLLALCFWYRKSILLKCFIDICWCRKRDRSSNFADFWCFLMILHCSGASANAYTKMLILLLLYIFGALNSKVMILHFINALTRIVKMCANLRCLFEFCNTHASWQACFGLEKCVKYTYF